MSKRAHRALLLLPLLHLAAEPAVAQVDRRSPEAALQDLEDGYVSDYDLFLFRRCPQQDAVGRAVFAAVQRLDLHGFGLEQVAGAFMQEVYPSCSYAPLHAWVTAVFQRLHRDGEVGAAEMFARGLPPLIDDDLQDALLEAAEDASFGGSQTRELLARVAYFHRPPDRRLDEGIAILGRDVPDQSRADITYYLGRNFRGRFFEAMASAAPTFDDAALFGVARAIATDIQDRRIDPNAPGLDALRTMVQGRPNRPAWVEIPVAPRPAVPERPR